MHLKAAGHFCKQSPEVHEDFNQTTSCFHGLNGQNKFLLKNYDFPDRWGLFISLFGLTLAIAQNYAEQLEYQRDSILQGQLWRIISAHFVHSNWQHSGLNVAGAILLAMIFKDSYPARIWLAFVFALNLLLSLGFLLFCPELLAYRGLSGTLHGILTLGLLAELAKGQKFYLLPLLALGIKMIHEAEGLHYNDMIGDLVITEAHFFGVVIATFLYLAIDMKKGKTED